MKKIYTLSLALVLAGVLAVSSDAEAVAANNPPSAPVISGPTTGSTGTAYSWSATSNDSDGDTLRYGYDWDKNGSVDQWAPSIGFISSGKTRTVSYSWYTSGAHTFQVLAQDFRGNNSGWSSHTITLAAKTCVWQAIPLDDFDGWVGPTYTRCRNNYNALGLRYPQCPDIGAVEGGTPSAVASRCLVDPPTVSCPDPGITRYTIEGLVNTCSGGAYIPPTPVPSFDLKINGSDGPLTVAAGANLNITWDPVSDATFCTGSGNGWNGVKSISGGSDNLPATASSLYSLTCTGPGGTITDTVSVSLTNILKVCEGSCSSGFMRGKSGTPQSFSMAQGSSKSLVACFNPANDCSDPSGTVTATFTEGGGPVISTSGTNPVTLSADTPGSESLSASYSGQTANMNVTVSCVPTTSCATDPRGDNYCPSETYTINDGCGTTLTCNGRRACDYNWKEVAP
ncbi:MAG: hypothetical protein A2808_02265 [Candidatus Moranbacteria bacterium RIFCSPHIGHO2_01_FULL_55_24]|nr:MAG: hypothetical protein A2808_02265 [Candidatus Moranbacteria bacterium RIFCSPHIGHO2_01_FULL_55_24]